MSKLVMVLAPHTDDGEAGCGGTIAKLTAQGDRVVYIAFSAAEESVLPQFPRDILRTEVKHATRVLGIREEDCLTLHFPVRKFPENRQEILEEMVKLNKEYKPDMVFLPCSNDTHQDHGVIAQEGFRAFKKTSMFGYELPWNNQDFKNTCFQVVSEEQLNLKVQALQCYLSQQHRTYAAEEFIRSWAITRGIQISERYAEAFEVVRLVCR